MPRIPTPRLVASGLLTAAFAASAGAGFAESAAPPPCR